jgi:hypothetical protein
MWKLKSTEFTIILSWSAEIRVSLQSVGKLLTFLKVYTGSAVSDLWMDYSKRNLHILILVQQKCLISNFITVCWGIKTIYSKDYTDPSVRETLKWAKLRQNQVCFTEFSVNLPYGVSTKSTLYFVTCGKIDKRTDTQIRRNWHERAISWTYPKTVLEYQVSECNHFWGGMSYKAEIGVNSGEIVIYSFAEK